MSIVSRRAHECMDFSKHLVLPMIQSEDDLFLSVTPVEVRTHMKALIMFTNGSTTRNIGKTCRNENVKHSIVASLSFVPGRIAKKTESFQSAQCDST